VVESRDGLVPSLSLVSRGRALIHSTNHGFTSRQSRTSTPSGFEVQAATSRSCTRFVATASFGHQHRESIRPSLTFTQLAVGISLSPCTVITILVRGLHLLSALLSRSILTRVKYKARMVPMTSTMTPMHGGAFVLTLQPRPFPCSRPALPNALVLWSVAWVVSSLLPYPRTNNLNEKPSVTVSIPVARQNGFSHERPKNVASWRRRSLQC